MLVGNDISQWQGQPNYDILKRNTNFLIIRSSYGNGYVDSQFIRNRNEVRRVAIPHGFYHYAYPQYNQPQAEAEWFVKTTSGIEAGEFLCLDFEEIYQNPVSWSKDFLDHISIMLPGYKPIIYMNTNLMNSFDWTPVAETGYGLWLAEWNGKPAETSPLKYWNIVAFHQWTNAQQVPGLTGGVDGDSFFGDLQTLSAYGYKPSPTQPPIPPTQDYKAFVTELRSVIAGTQFSWQKINTIKQLLLKYNL